jgi:hypothetical protein
MLMALSTELFVAFHPMWAGPNLAFSFDFMSKFLVDMEALADTKPLQVAQIERLLRFLKYAPCNHTYAIMLWSLLLINRPRN